eukprot:6188659-Pleurochrysis_carterae.AAC.5
MAAPAAVPSPKTGARAAAHENVRQGTAPRLLVTGGCGFVMAHVVREWLDAIEKEETPGGSKMGGVAAAFDDRSELGIGGDWTRNSCYCVVFDREGTLDGPLLRHFGEDLERGRVQIFAGGGRGCTCAAGFCGVLVWGGWRKLECGSFRGGEGGAAAGLRMRAWQCGVYSLISSISGHPVNKALWESPPWQRFCHSK